MAPMFHLETLLPSSISPKINSILQSHIYPQVGHVFHALAKFKSLLVKVLSKKRTPRSSGTYTISYHPQSRSAKSGKKSKIASFVKLQFTWAASSSSAQERDLDVNHVHSYYDSTWSVAVPGEEEEVCGGEGDDRAERWYLCWLEDERSDDAPVAEEGEDDGDNAMNEIDRLAARSSRGATPSYVLAGEAGVVPEVPGDDGQEHVS